MILLVQIYPQKNIYDGECYLMHIFRYPRAQVTALF